MDAATRMEDAHKTMTPTTTIAPIQVAQPTSVVVPPLAQTALEQLQEEDQQQQLSVS